MVYVPNRQVAKWIEGELERHGAAIQLARSMGEVVRSLTDASHQPDLLIIDMAATTAAQVLELHSVRDDGWDGHIIAMGRVSPALKASLKIEYGLRPPFVRDLLRDMVAALPPTQVRLPELAVEPAIDAPTRRARRPTAPKKEPPPRRRRATKPTAELKRRDE